MQSCPSLEHRRTAGLRRLRTFARSLWNEEVRPKHDDQCASREYPRLEKQPFRPLLSPCGFVAPIMPFAIRQRFPETGRSKFFGTGLMRHVLGFEQAILQMQQQSAGCLQVVTSPDGTSIPSGVATPRLSGS